VPEDVKYELDSSQAAQRYVKRAREFSRYFVSVASPTSGAQASVPRRRLHAGHRTDGAAYRPPCTTVSACCLRQSRQ